MRKKYNYVEGVELGLTSRDVELICQSGSNDEQVAEITKKKYVQKQLKNYSDEALMKVVRAYSDSDISNIKTREDKERYVVWTVAWNIFDNI